MNDKKGSGIPDMETFLREAGSSLGRAQAQLSEGTDLHSQIVLASAELEVRTSLDCDDRGNLAVRPISSTQLKAGINPGTLSTLRLHYVAASTEPPADDPAPERTRDEILREVMAVSDVMRMNELVGPLKADATYVPKMKKWLVTITDRRGRTIRELTISDPAGEG